MSTAIAAGLVLGMLLCVVPAAPVVRTGLARLPHGVSRSPSARLGILMSSATSALTGMKLLVLPTRKRA